MVPTDSTEIAVPRGHYRVTLGSYECTLREALGLPHYGAMVAGREVHWFFTGTMLRKFICELVSTGDEVTSFVTCRPLVIDGGATAD